MSKTKSECQDKNSKTKEPTIEEVERELRRIMAATDNTKVWKQQEIFRLMRLIGLPTHSADIHCIGLTYPQMFERVQKWIQNKQAHQHAKKMVWAAWFSALTAFVAVLFSIYIYCQTQ